MCRIPIARSSFPNPLGDSPRKSRAKFDAFETVVLIFLMILPGIFAVFISLLFANIFQVPEFPRNRQIILDVPEKSSVNAQVTSGDHTVNLKNL